MPGWTPQMQPAERLVADRYRLRRVIGRGAMGTVWLAYDEVLRRDVAVKQVRLPPGVPAGEADAVRQRTLREARAIAALTHPNVISVYDVAGHDGEPFVVMELMAARSLAEVVRRHGPLSAGQAVLVADAVAAALAAAHRRGITHRDVKPANVLVGVDRQIKLTDFGIAHNVAESTMSTSGLILGTPAFIAPEVASGDPVTPAADLWGLGATLFAAVEGYPPYDAGGALETVTAVVHDEVPRPRPDAPLADIITGLMVKDPAGRMPLAEVRRRLQPLLPNPASVSFPIDPAVASAGRPDPQPPTPPRPAPAPAAEPGGSTSSAALAADPGPLPFLPTAPVPRRRRAGRTVALFTLAAVLFVTAAAGGFAATRLVAGRPLLPSRQPATPAVPQAAPVRTLVPQTGDAAISPGAAGGIFTVSVPQGWREFVEQRTSRSLPPSVVVRYVKPDGTQELTIERFPNFYPQFSADEYVSALDHTLPGGDFVLLTDTAVASRGGANPPQATWQVSYRTVESAGTTPADMQANSVRRSTYADLFRYGGDLWVLTVTVPTEQEDGGTRLFNLIAQTFAAVG